jgi:fibronectin type 3 domain-containing protein
MSVTGNYRVPNCSRVALRVAFIFMACFGLTSCGAAAIENPTGLATPHSITVTWDASPSIVSGYVVYRSTDTVGPFIPVQTTLAATMQYTDTNVVAGQTYFYMVTAYDSALVESIPSNLVSATVPVP